MQIWCLRKRKQNEGNPPKNQFEVVLRIWYFWHSKAPSSQQWPTMLLSLADGCWCQGKHIFRRNQAQLEVEECTKDMACWHLYVKTCRSGKHVKIKIGRRDILKNPTISFYNFWCACMCSCMCKIISQSKSWQSLPWFVCSLKLKLLKLGHWSQFFECVAIAPMYIIFVKANRFSTHPKRFFFCSFLFPACDFQLPGEVFFTSTYTVG